MDLPASTSLQTDWKLCCLCQRKTKERLRKVSNIVSNQTVVLNELSENIKQFHTLNCLPIYINPKRLDNGDGITKTLIDNCASYHLSCKLLFNIEKLQRVKNRNNSRKHKLETTLESPREKRQRLEKSVLKCFICEKEDDIKHLHNIETFNTCEKLKDLASELNETKLLKTISCEDPIAQELKYHSKCFISLKNRVRAIRSMQEKIKNGDAENVNAYSRAFAEIITYIHEQKMLNSANNTCAFKLSKLVNLYSQRLRQLGVSIPIVNKTRFKENLLSHVSELSVFRNGREVLLSFDKEVGPILLKACSYSDAIQIEKTAFLLRKEMLQCNSKFDGHFQNDYTKNCVPHKLVQFVESSLIGVKIGSDEKIISEEKSALAHLFQFNCHQRYKKDASSHRHSSQRETAFPVYLGLSVYARYRKEALVDLLFENGLSISYKRVLELANGVGQSVVETFERNGVVCPFNLKKGTFTSSAIDNIDHNPTAASAKSSFHGTSISLFQHSSNQGIPQENVVMLKQKVNKISPLPEHYTNVKPASFTEQPSPPKHDIPDLPSSIEPYLDNQYLWLNKVFFTQEVNDSVKVTWASHYSHLAKDKHFEVGVSSLLPLLRDQAHDVATIKHALDKIKEAVTFLNPTQSPVVTVDQPLFALAKQIQWSWPDQYQSFVFILGGLHIEMTILKMIGQILHRSG